MFRYRALQARLKYLSSSVAVPNGPQAGGGVLTPTILLSASTVDEDASVGTTVAALSVSNLPDGVTVSSYSLTSNPGLKFAIDGTDLETAASFDFETAQSHSITIRATLSDASTVDGSFVITVNNVLENTLSALTLDTSEIESGSAAGTVVGAIQGRTEGSALLLTDDASGRFALSGENIIAGLVATDYDTTQSHNITIRETIGDATNSPRDSVIAITVTQVAAALSFGSLAVRTDGWTMDATIGGAKDGGSYANLNDADDPGLALTVRSRSWDEAGEETTVDRTVYATTVLRNPYPSQTTLQETEDGSDLDVIFTLSSYIHADDEILTCSIAAGFFTDDGTGGSTDANTAQSRSVTNNSAVNYPPPVAAWLDHDLTRVQTDTFSPRLAVMHWHGRNGQPVRAVKFIATDENENSVEAMATGLTTDTWTASNLYANYFTAALDFTQLVQGDLVTIDAIIYPWIGDEYQLSVDAETYPSRNLSVMKVLNDRTGEYGTVYAYVDGTGAGTPAVHENPATAATTPYASIAAAAAAIQTYNNSNFSRNNVSGGIIRIAASTTLSGLGTDNLDTQADGDIPLVIEGVSQSTSIYQDAGANSNNDVNNKLKFKNLTINKTADQIGLFGDNSTSSLDDDICIFEDVIFANGGGAALTSTWAQRLGRMAFINCSGAYFGLGGASGSVNHATMLALGCTFFPIRAHAQIACKDLDTLVTEFVGPGATANFAEAIKGGFYGWNWIGDNNTDIQKVHMSNVDLGPRGMAVVGNIVESYGSTAGPSMAIEPSSALANTNLLEYGNTVVGQRTNNFYNDAGNVALKGFSKHSIHTRHNHKGDVHGEDGSLVGNWAIRHRVDGGYNLAIDGDSNDNTPGAGGWIGEIAAVGDVIVGDADFVDDQSGAGTGTGDYTPGASTTVPQIPAGETYFSWDLLGNPIPSDGTAYAGAVQIAEEEPSSEDLLLTDHGITFELDSDTVASSGQFRDGSYWVVPVGETVTVIQKYPVWDGTKHGAMVDPVPLAPQGYDSRPLDSEWQYSDSARPTFPLAMSPNSSLVGFESLETVVAGGGREYGKRAAVLTVLSEAPASPSTTFRPQFCAGTKTLYTEADVDLSFLPGLTPIAGLTPFDWETEFSEPSAGGQTGDIGFTLKHAMIDHGPSVHGMRCCPQLNYPGYGEYVARVMSRAAVHMLYDHDNTEEIAYRIVQIGIDLIAVHHDNSGAWRGNGGHNQGRKFPIVFTWKALGLAGAPDFFWDSFPTLPKFSEDFYPYYGQPTAIYPNGKPLWGIDAETTGESPYAGNSTVRDPDGLLNPEMMDTYEELPFDGGHYRYANWSYPSVGAVIAVREMGLTSLWTGGNTTAFFDYIDSWVQEPWWWEGGGTSEAQEDANGFGGRTVNPGRYYQKQTWENLRGSTPVLTAPTIELTGASTGTATITTTEANGIVYYMVVDSEATAPTAVDIIAAANAAAITAADARVPATGHNSHYWESLIPASFVSAGGLKVDASGVVEFEGITVSEGEYVYFCHVGANTKRSNVTGIQAFLEAPERDFITPTDSRASSANAASYPFDDVAIGPAFTGRGIAIAVSMRGLSGSTISGVTVDGVAADAVTNHGTTSAAAIYTIPASALPSSSVETVDVVVTIGTALGSRAAIDVFVLDNAADLATGFDVMTPHSDVGSPIDFSLDSPASGGAILLAGWTATTGGTGSWSGATQASYREPENSVYHACGYALTETLQEPLTANVSNSGTPANVRAVGVSWT